MVSSFLTRGLVLIGEPALKVLCALLGETANDYFSAEAGMHLVRGDVVDAGVVVLAVITVKVFCEVGHGLSVVQKLVWVSRGEIRRRCVAWARCGRLGKRLCVVTSGAVAR